MRSRVDEPLPRRAVGHRGDGDHVVGAAGPVRELREVQQSSVVVLRELRHPCRAVLVFELVFVHGP